MRSLYRNRDFRLCQWIYSFGILSKRHVFTKTTDDPHDPCDSITVPRDVEVQQWLESLGPDMEFTMQKIERKIRFLKKSEQINNDIVVTLEDLKDIVKDGSTLSGIKRYLKNKPIVMKMDRQNRENRRRKELQNQDDSSEFIDPYTYFESNYVSVCSNQEDRHIKHGEAMAARNDPMPVVFDMDYDVAIGNQYKAVKLIDRANKLNRTFPEPCSIHVTNAFKSSILAERLKAGLYDDDFLKFHEKGFEDLFPHQYLVYLCPDAPPLLTHIPGDIYVISGFCETSQLSLEKVKRLNIRCGSIPFIRFGIKKNRLRKQAGYVLTLDNVFDLALNINLKQEWQFVMNDIIMKYNLNTKFRKKAEYDDFL